MMRKINSNENMFDDPVERSFMNIRSVTVESKIDFYVNLDLLKKAIQTWRRAHPLLQSKIVKVDDENGDKIKCFHLADEIVFEKLSNVKFLSFESNDEDEQSFGNDFWVPLLEHEFMLTIDSENGPLWRLVFIRSKHNIAGLFRYNLFFTCHHAIIDGRNAFYLVAQLLRVIENVFLDKPVKLTDYKCLPSLHEQPLIKERYCEFLSKHQDEEQQSKPPLVPETLRNHHFNKKPSFAYKSKFIDIETNSIFKSYSELLIEENYNGIAITRLSKENFDKLNQKSKSNDVKLTGTLNTILLMSLQSLYKRFTAGTQLPAINYLVMVNLRPHLAPLVDNFMMGYYATFLEFTCSKEVVNTADNNWRNDFWEYAKADSKCLHEKIKTGGHIDAVIHGEVTNEEALVSHMATKDDYTTLYQFVLSNLGDMTHLSETESKMVKLKEHFSAMCFKRNVTPCDFFINICSIDGESFWAFSYNKRFFKNEALDFFINKFHWIIEEIVKD